MSDQPQRLPNYVTRARYVTNIQFVLQAFVGMKGSQKAAARALGVSPQYLCDLLKERREVSDVVAQKLGYRRVVHYERATGR